MAYGEDSFCTPLLFPNQVRGTSNYPKMGLFYHMHVIQSSNPDSSSFLHLKALSPPFPGTPPTECPPPEGAVPRVR